MPVRTVPLLATLGFCLAISGQASAMPNGLREFFQALGELGRQANQARQGNVVALLLFGGPEHKEFLGCLNCGEADANSVGNSFSQYGFANNFGTWNSFGQYASRFSAYSACNQFAADPPVIVDAAGNFYGRFSINQFVIGSVCSAIGNQQACQLVTAVCQSKS